MRIEGFRFTPPITFYGVVLEGFVEFTGKSLESIQTVAQEVQNGIRNTLPADKVQVVKITIEELK